MASVSNQKTPMTESSNPITLKLDLSTPAEMADLFKRCDLECFTGPENQPDHQENSLLKSADLQSKIQKVANLLKKENSSNPIVIFSGCGTSGRLGYLAKVAFQESNLLPHCQFEYLIAGGDKALLTSQEAHEDKPLEGLDDLHKILNDKYQNNYSHVIMICITCGMSAPYCAGQLEYALNTDKFIPVLISFNTVENARKIPIPTWNNRTFSEVALKIDQAQKENQQAFIINPSLGGEHVTGSSRMKGGTATKAILDAIFLTAVFEDSKPLDHLQKMYDSIITYYSNNSELIAELITKGGQALMEDKSIIYLGQQKEGALGLIDGTECKPTYGATLNDVRGFVQGGFPALNNNEGDISHYGDEFKIDFQDLEILVKNDTIKPGIVIVHDSPLGSSSSFNMPKNLNFDIQPICLKFPFQDINQNPKTPNDWTKILISQLLYKLTYNCISTGAHVLKGKVMQNFMIDVSLTNLKLFVRGRELIRRFIPNLDIQTAVNYLLMSIYGVDQLNDEITQITDEQHVSNATKAAVEKGMIVPVAIILAAYREVKRQKDFTIEDARKLLAGNPRCRQVLVEILQN